jgi:hypothetical protein
MRRWRSGLLTALLLVVVGGAIGPSGAMGATTYMSCGSPPTYDSSFDISSEGRIRYVAHPKHCAWTDNGFTYRLVNLVELRWRHWGKRRAFARGQIADSHDQDNNGFQRHPVRVVAFDPRPAVGHSGANQLYYTRLRVIPPASWGRSFVERLFRPGQQPVMLRSRPLSDEGLHSRARVSA